jgi:hypothetical protein
MALTVTADERTELQRRVRNYGTHKTPLIRTGSRSARAFTSTPRRPRIVTEPCGALVRCAHEQTTASRGRPQRRPAQDGDSGVHRGASCEGNPLCVDQERQRNPRQHCALRSTNTRLSGRATYCANHAVKTLDSIDMRTSSDLRDRALIGLMIYKLLRRWLALDTGDDHQAAVR